MSELYEKSLLKLELDRVLEMLAERAGSELGKIACRKLRPTSDLEDVQALLDQTTLSDICKFFVHCIQFLLANYLL